MWKRLICASCLIFCVRQGFANHIEPVIDQPNPTELNKVQRTLLLDYLEYLGNVSPEHCYRIAEFYIQIGELPQARIHLEQAIELDPHFTAAYLQLGFIDLWEKKWEEAFAIFSIALEETPCAVTGLIGLTRVALHWAEEQPARARSMANKVHLCHSQDPDSLLYLGILYTRLQEWEKGEETLTECLRLAPHYQDAQLQLAHLYVLEKKYEEAEKIYHRYPDCNEADKGLARIASQEGKYADADKLYQKVLEKDPKDSEARKALAQTLVSQLKYAQAKKQYELLLESNGATNQYTLISPREDASNWIQSMDVKSHTNFGILEEVDYTDAKEWDPTLRVPVVKDYYFSSKLTLFFPIFDRWRIDVQQLYFHQRENDIFVPSVNYSAFVNGGALISHYYFARDWKWDIVAKTVHASGIHEARYPFKSSTLFEPGTTLLYHSDWNLFVLDGHVEDQIIKNFPLTISQLLRIDNYHGIYGFHPPVYLHPHLEVSGGANFYHDSLHNRKDYQKVLAAVDLGIHSLIATYVFEHGHFKKLSEDYFSYQKQIQHTLSVRYIQDFYAKVQFEVLWDHIWQSNHNVFLPIGNFVFVSPNLYLIANRITGTLKYRFRDSLRAEIGGHYLTITLPYWDWNLRGAISWQF